MMDTLVRGSGSCKAHSLLSPHLLETSGGKDPFSKPRLDTLSSNEGTLILCEAEDNMGHHSAELPVWWVLPGRGT